MSCAPFGALDLLQLDSAAGLLELLLHVLGLGLRDLLLDGLGRAVHQVLGLLQPEAGQLADDDEVGARDPFVLERTGRLETRPQRGRTQVGIDAERFSQVEEASLGPAIGRCLIEFRVPDRSEQYGVGRPACTERALRQRASMRADGGPADGPDRSA